MQLTRSLISMYSAKSEAQHAARLLTRTYRHICTGVLCVAFITIHPGLRMQALSPRIRLKLGIYLDCCDLIGLPFMKRSRIPF
ncbi:hypothetical protein BGW36DRAFT_389820 [Talaromyces proteolyticus]|uniref:Uncharacterized protein n=1 Tax=Talaromyces proteolyticus TaxID=1131652 RepID=A0AAD4PUW7_9EURO|nr:uncharacterized protein BGW36DRAFT_389820 [Talaromyces proteolyticus]KAH8689848.1 hypothetical protein BGW36DRAFT_389820 [Talaromyces proteolyticus]